MGKLNVPLPGRAYEIQIEHGILKQAGDLCRKVLPKARKLALVTDHHVEPLYGNMVRQSLKKAGFSVHTTIIPAGEASKSMTQLEHLYEEFMAFELTRTDAVVALGGGVVGDLAGFAAATILRGVDLIQIPTTLLAQVDSSVGGKVAVDLPAGKNLVGAFWQPKLVLMDPACLNTLSDAVFYDGMAEVLKYGCIKDSDFFQLLMDCGGRQGVMKRIEEVLYTCCSMKAEVVRMDERDTGLRMLLNFGHTLGHAYEQAYHYETYTHGQAVAAGMVAAAELGERLSITPAGTSERIRAAVRCYELPERIDCPMEAYQNTIGLDKKGAGLEINMILLEQLGRAKIVKLEKQRLFALLGEIYGS